MKVTVEMLQNLGACGPASTYVGQWFIDNNVEIIDYDLGMAYLKSLMGHGQAWINENVSEQDHSDYANWIAWYEKLPTMLEAITYFGDHIVENTFMTIPDGLLHGSIESARAHNDRVVNELRDDYITKIVLNGVNIDSEGNETWIKIKDPNTEDLSQYEAFIYHDILTGLNTKTEIETEAVTHYNNTIEYVNNITASYRASCSIQQRYMDEAAKYTIWVKVE